MSVPPSPDSFPKNTKSHLAFALATGETAAGWARQNDVDARTAQRWARKPEVQAAVESIRRRTIDVAVGVLIKDLKDAASQIVALGKSADSESVRLSASRAVLSDMMAVYKFGELENRMTEIEEHIRADTRNQSRTS